MDRYVLRALAGQTMTIDVSSAQAHMLFQVNGADGNVLKSFGAGASHWSMPLPTTQDYINGITTEDSSAATYTLTVTIPPSGGGDTHSLYDRHCGACSHSDGLGIRE